MQALLGIDVGGTFTDAVLVWGGSWFRAKIPTTLDQSEGVIGAALKVLEQAGIGPAQVSYFAHGMTTATNALLERKGARTASITTMGFRDILEIGRQSRPQLYDLCPQRPQPLVPAAARLVVRERIAPQGVIASLEPAEAERVVARLKELKPEAVAVCLLFSFLDATHERQLAQIIQKRLPGVHTSLSSRVLPQFREFERFSTTAVDAYLTPVVARYLSRLQDGATAIGLPSPAIMQSSGGVLPLEQAVASAAPLLLSGPAAGVVGAIYAGARYSSASPGADSVEDLIAFDMGGTSTDVTLIRGGAAQTTTEREIGGSPVALPMIDIHTIGAGGGSIAWIDAGGALRVGPESAGAHPGPACYGWGGNEATVTDANLCLGYLGQHLGRRESIALNRDAARTVMQKLARSLGAGLEEAALGIRQVANGEMVKALRVISIEQGHDPRGFVLVAFGGAGPLHGADLADELGIARVLIPDSCGVLSALGMVIGEQRRDWVKTVYVGGDWDRSFLSSAFAGLEKQARQVKELAGAHLIRRVDLRYQGQSHELSIVIEGEDPALIQEAFAREHEKVYGYRAEGEVVELINVRLTALLALQRPVAAQIESARGLPQKRRAFFGREWLEAEVWQRLDLGAGAGVPPVAGPAIIEEEEATTLVPPDWLACLDNAGNLWLERQ